MNFLHCWCGVVAMDSYTLGRFVNWDVYSLYGMSPAGQNQPERFCKQP